MNYNLKRLIQMAEILPPILLKLMYPLIYNFQKISIFKNKMLNRIIFLNFLSLIKSKIIFISILINDLN